jgi:ribosomal protein L37AE/L43A
VDTTLLVPQRSRQPFGFLKSQYVLKKVDDRVEVYVFQGVSQHYACPHCFAKDTIQILQYQRIESGCFKCPGCKTLFVMTHPTGLVSLI